MKPSPNYLAIVRAYADAMIEQGQRHKGLFPEELNRSTMRMLEGDSLKEVAALKREQWGIRSHDRMLGGANPQHCEDLYQILFALTDITGDQHYRRQAEKSLKYFFENCQSPATGLLWWGEHAGWDLREDKPLAGRNTHEFYRPWVLWPQGWALAEGACERFARGLWEHQIGDQETGDYSRHASIASHGTDTEAPYARHGGFYLETWAHAYRHTGDKVFLRAIRSVLGGLERARLHEGGMLTSRTKKDGGRTPYDVSLAISLEEAARQVPADLAKELRDAAAANDAVFARAQSSRGGHNASFANAYGGGRGAAKANCAMLRLRQNGLGVYRGFILDAADAYRSAEIDLAKPVWPGTVGDVILLMLNAHELTGKNEYLKAADRFARRAIELFLADGCPLPKASHEHEHYEAVTNGDTLMMALLRLHLVGSGQPTKARLVFTNR